MPWHFLRPAAEAVFAHPAEEELANILSFYRVRWLYEPTSFVLKWSPDGRAVQSFTPDFYLPEHRLYIELTTMRQPLVTRKNRKLRLLREMYPGVNIKLLYRRDVEQLLGAYRERDRAGATTSHGPIISTEEQIRTRIEQLAAEIATSDRFSLMDSDRRDPLLVLGIAPGAITFKRHLVNALRSNGVSVEIDRILTTRYRMPRGSDHVRVVKSPRGKLAGRDVLIVADVISTGLSVQYLVNWLRRNGARRVEVCSLYSRSRARLIDLDLRFHGFEAPDEPIVGFGIGRIPELRSLPHVSLLQHEKSDNQ